MAREMFFGGQPLTKALEAFLHLFFVAKHVYMTAQQSTVGL
jgi:hypothetical protein